MKADVVMASVCSRDLISEDLWNRLRSRVQRDGQFSAGKADAVVDGTLSFLRLCGQFRGERLSPSKDIDVGWHAFTLHTRDYEAFWERVAGHLIHHEPTRPGERNPARTVASTIEFMRQHSIDFDPLLWAMSKANCDSGPPDCGETDCSSEGPG